MNGEAHYISTATVIQPIHVCRVSFWIDAPRECFTAFCRQHVFRDEPRERWAARKLAGVAAEQAMTG